MNNQHLLWMDGSWLVKFEPHWCQIKVGASAQLWNKKFIENLNVFEF